MDEKGQLINIFDNKNLEDYASKFLQGRKLYFLIKIIPRQDVKGTSELFNFFFFF